MELAKAFWACIATPQGIAEVVVQTFCHEQRLLAAGACVQALRRA